MKKTLSLTLSFTVAFLGFISAAAPRARGQEIASAGNSITKIREDYERLLAVERNPETPPEVKEMNHNFLAERRAQLVAALRTRINALRMYQASVVSTLSAEEKQAVENSIGKLVEELESLQPRKEAPARSAQTVTASFDGARAEPVRRAARNDGAPLEILSPDRDKTLHVSEVELEIAVNDEDIDDLMVAVYTPASEKPRSARVLNLKRSDKGTKSVVVALAKGDNRIEVSDLKRGGVRAERNITYKTPEAPGVGAGPGAVASARQAGGGAAAPQPSPTPFIQYDWGRVRAYFAGGMIFSKEREEFSKSDLALSFVLDKNYIKSKRWNLNTFFEARLAAVPVAARDTDAADDDGGGDDGEGEDANQFDAFITSKKAGFAQAGVYLPVNVTGWRNQGEFNTLFAAPLAKGGVMTISGDTRTAEAETFGDDDVYNFFSFGVRLGHFRYPKLRNPCPPRPKEKASPRDEAPSEEDDPLCDDESSYAPELISWLDITTGRWENFEVVVPTGQLDNAGDPITVRQRRWRYQAEGRLKIPETPFLIGFDGNFGKGPDDLRFLFGMRFDVGKLIHRLKIQQLFEEQQQQQP